MARIKVSFTCQDSLLANIIAALHPQGVSAVVVSNVNGVSEDKPILPLQPIAPQFKELVPDRSKNVAKSIEIANGKMTTPASSWPSGRTILKVFETVPLARYPDIDGAMKKAGYSTSSSSSIVDGLLREGVIERVSRGAYRLTPR